MKSPFEKMIGAKVPCDYAWAAGDFRADMVFLIYYIVSTGEQ